jgi:hypothetical protein
MLKLNVMISPALKLVPFALENDEAEKFLVANVA